MDEQNRVDLWKQPTARRNQNADHPAGEIRLRTGDGLTRRADLLGAATVDQRDIFTTMSWI
ncbi:hypothetical protein P3T37_006347 [Kitasatospora sp. MAA4]|uniref:hypothetical protein n=1 Tax=Kitasatospora sp. MAA4 TaxID=3035093 RepID=UPI0024767FDB|nr:hypothetical protein [Kitasatospora sp. MAA4]MDH6136916.1 hypothetical protein [Kitasatospora sp. MAA4]